MLKFPLKPGFILSVAFLCISALSSLGQTPIAHPAARPQSAALSHLPVNLHAPAQARSGGYRTGEIRIHVNQMTDKNVVITEPVNGSFFWSNRKTALLDDSGRVTIRLRAHKAGPVTLGNGGVYVNLFLSPGDKVAVEIHPADTALAFLVSGRNADGQMQLNAKRGYYLFKSDDYLKKYKPISAALHQVKVDLETELIATRELYKQHRIGPAFRDFAILNSQYYYAAVMAAIVKSKYDATTIYPKTSSNYRPSFDQAEADAWDEIYEKYPLNNVRALASFTYFDYLSDYVKVYINRYKAELKGTFKEMGEDWLTPVYAFFAGAPLKPGVREYGLAGFLQNEAFQDTYDPKLITLYKRFTREYPANPYSIFLKSRIDPIIAFQQKENAAFGAGQKILSGYDSVGSLDQLLDSFKGKTVFIDVWATWCGPCKEEFRYSDSLRQFLQANGVEMLYIAMDNDKADKHWKTMIKYYNLAGTHVRANQSLQKELMSRRDVTAIPRYFIIDKSGNIAEKNALRPSDKEKLYDQIRGYL